MSNSQSGRAGEGRIEGKAGLILDSARFMALMSREYYLFVLSNFLRNAFQPLCLFINDDSQRIMNFRNHTTGNLEYKPLFLFKKFTPHKNPLIAFMNNGLCLYVR